MFKIESKEKTPKYNYEKLSALMKEEELPKENVNFYGIISDCSNIVKNQYQLIQITFQVLDDTCNANSTEKLISVAVTSKEENIPYFIRLGDIVRIHRGKLSAYNEQRKVHLNKGGHWTIFSGELKDDFEPIFKSSKNITFEDHDKSLIILLRNFANEYFRNENVYKLHNYTSLSVKGKEDHSKQSLVLVKERKEIQDLLVFKVVDSKNFYEIRAEKTKYSFILEDDVLILKYVKTEKEQIILNPNSIILIVPRFFNLFTLFKTTIEEIQETEIFIDFKDIELITSQSQFIEERTEDDIFREQFHKFLEKKKQFFIKCKAPQPIKINLNQIQDHKISTYNTFNSELMVIAISPKDEREYVKVYCRECNQFFSTKNYTNDPDQTEGFICPNESCKNNYCLLIFHVILHCVTEYNSTKVFHFFLSTYDEKNNVNKGLNFFKGLHPKDLYKNPQILSEIKKCKAELTSFLTFIDVNCEVITVVNSIANKKEILFRIIGEY